MENGLVLMSVAISVIKPMMKRESKSKLMSYAFGAKGEEIAEFEDVCVKVLNNGIYIIQE
jgi:hypothetical protein